MYGKNPVARSRSADQGFLVHSIFYTIQGEGPFAGMPAIFLRMAGCNLRCYWCDTDFSEENATEYTPAALAEKLFQVSHESKCDLVVITGGEPLLQPIDLLLWHQSLVHCKFQIETAGTVWPNMGASIFKYVRSTPTIVCSPKTPLVVEELRNRHSAFDIYWKYIVRADEAVSPEDGLPLYPTQLHGRRQQPVYRPHSSTPRQRIFVQACDQGEPYANKQNQELAAEIAMKYGYRLSVQLHKVVGVD